MMVPVASIVLVWQVLFNANGVVNDFLGLTGADKIDWNTRSRVKSWCSRSSCGRTWATT